MSDEKFTPGEWRAEFTRVILPDGRTIHTPAWGGGDDFDVQKANAALIATAPEMYEKLKEIQNFFFTFSFRLLKCNEKKNAEQWMKKSMEIYKLLKKARGEV